MRTVPNIPSPTEVESRELLMTGSRSGLAVKNEHQCAGGRYGGGIVKTVDTAPLSAGPEPPQSELSKWAQVRLYRQYVEDWLRGHITRVAAARQLRLVCSSIRPTKRLATLIFNQGLAMKIRP